MKLCTAALFIIGKNLNKSGYPSIDECTSKVGYIHVRANRIYHPKICLSGIRDISVSLKKKKKNRNLRKLYGDSSVVKDIYNREISIFKGCPSLHQK